MITPTAFPPIAIAGIVFCIIAMIICTINVFRDKNWPFAFPTFLVLAGIGISLLLINGLQVGIREQNDEKVAQSQIESMSCSQLHDALLHNTINGTSSDVQRATERYVAGCESK